MTREELRLNCACVDAIRETFGQPPLYAKRDERVVAAPTPASQYVPRLTTLAQRIRAAVPDAEIHLVRRERGSLLRVVVAGREVIRHDAEKHPIRDLLPKVEKLWGRIW